MMRVILMILCLQLGYAYAEEPAAPVETTDKPAEATRTSAPASERFEPSEQISEDLSVSFPADI